jgi:predicted RNA binding protein YcfA (HicA-like mRNA interferase family)
MDLYDKIKRNQNNVTPRQLINLLLRFGFQLKRTTGDHEIYKRAGYRSFPVPIRQNPLARHIVQAALALIAEIRESEDTDAL